jgi:hypothetical protein
MLLGVQREPSSGGSLLTEGSYQSTGKQDRHFGVSLLGRHGVWILSSHRGSGHRAQHALRYLFPMQSSRYLPARVDRVEKRNETVQPHSVAAEVSSVALSHAGTRHNPCSRSREIRRDFGAESRQTGRTGQSRVMTMRRGRDLVEWWPISQTLGNVVQKAKTPLRSLSGVP